MIMERSPSNRSKRGRNELEVVAGNGLLDRRAFLRGGAVLAATMTGYTFVQSAAAESLADDPWSKEPGTLVTAYGMPSRFEKSVARTLSNPKGEPRTQHARTPHHPFGVIVPLSRWCGVRACWVRGSPLGLLSVRATFFSNRDGTP